MIRKLLRTTTFLSVLFASSMAMSQSMTPCDFCEVQLYRCVNNGVFSYEQCMNMYRNCREEACELP